MEETSRLHCHTRESGHRYEGGGNTVVLKSNVKHIQWIYRQMRREGLKPADARMSLVFAVHAGQRDIRNRVEDAVRSI